jgi:hypothetical protein
LVGGVPGLGVMVGESKKSNKPSKPPGMYINGAKTALIALKITKNAVFNLKMFFEEYIDLKIFCYLRCCGVTPVHSFGSHILPQPPRLGLNNRKITRRTCPKKVQGRPYCLYFVHLQYCSIIVLFFLN